MANPVKAAKQMFDQFISKHDPTSNPTYDPKAKDQQAQAAGRIGGKKGGLARAASLSPTRRRQIAKRAAKAKWIKARATD